MLEQATDIKYTCNRTKDIYITNVTSCSRFYTTNGNRKLLS